MALQSLQIMVKMRLPFLPDGATVIPNLGGLTINDMIDSSICEQYYYLQPYTGLVAPDVEDESKYSQLQKMLIAELVGYFLICNKTLENVGGVGGEAAEGAQQIKKGKADVVEVEFGYGKASDGNFLGANANDLMMKFAKRACDIAAQLGYSLPFCEQLGLCGVEVDVPAFIFVENKDLNCKC